MKIYSQHLPDINDNKPVNFSVEFSGTSGIMRKTRITFAPPTTRLFSRLLKNLHLIANSTPVAGNVCLHSENIVELQLMLFTIKIVDLSFLCGVFAFVLF